MNIVLSKESSEEQIKAYFNAVLELSKKQEEFPINFDEVWMIVYEDKRSAIYELKDKFLQGIDYQTVRKKVKASNVAGYVWADEYKLTISCMEFFIARKVRPVFEVYRQIFHKATELDFKLPNFNNPAEAARAWALEYEAKQQAQLEAKEAQDNVKRLVHDSKTYTAGEIAKEVGLRSAIELNNQLAKMEVQFKQNGTWLLYAKYADLGYTSVKQTVLDNGRIIYDRRWTGVGRDFIVSLFKEE
jgi:phage antirepressor YoqD-like protein